MLFFMSQPAKKLPLDDRVVLESEYDEQGQFIRRIRRAPTEEERELLAETAANPPRGPWLTTEEFEARTGLNIRGR
jgi:hypothetical protein